EAVVLEGRARTGQVHDDVGDAQAGVQLQGALRIDHLVIINAPFPEVLPDHCRILGRNPKGLPGDLELRRQIHEVHDVADVDPALGDGDDQPAATVTEVGNDHGGVLGLEGVLGVDVHPGDAQVAAALLDLDHDV